MPEVKDACAFEILKSPVDFKIIAKSESLQHELQEALKANFELLCDAGTKTSHTFNGLALLKHRADLFKRLKCLRSAPPLHGGIGGLSLLVNDVLSDGELFASFGHSRLLEQGWLSPDQLKIFQMSRVHRQIDALEQLRGMPDEEYTTLSLSGLDHQDLLLRAVLDGNHRAVDALFRIATITHDSRNKPTGFEVDLNWGDGDRNLLLAAVRGGQQDIVKLLLEKGAHVDAGTETQTALCVAAQMRDESMVRLLLDYGADYGMAELLLRMSELKGLSTHPLNRLRAYVARYKKDGLAEKRTKAMQLRFQFWREHQHIKRTAQEIPSQLATYSWNWKPSQWEHEIELDSRSAWSTSLRVLRGLCRGVLPRSLNATLLFLALAKNMSSIIHNDDERGTIDFKDDLARWQLLFDNSEISLWGFRQAVKNIWDVDVDHLWYFHTVSSALESFQNLVFEFSNLMADSEDHQTSGTGHPGLLSVQASWRERLLQTSAPRSDSDEPHYTDPPNHGCCEKTGPNSVPATKAEDPIFPIPERDKNTLPTRDRLVLVILMAGAIFAAIFAFLLCKSSPSKSRYTND